MKIEWRRNLSVLHKRIDFYDLFIDERYMSMWIAHHKQDNTYQFCSFSGINHNGPVFDTFEEAKEWYNTLCVINKLEGA